jgi:hypothetical protein
VCVTHPSRSAPALHPLLQEQHCPAAKLPFHTIWCVSHCVASVSPRAASTAAGTALPCCRGRRPSTCCPWYPWWGHWWAPNCHPPQPVGRYTETQVSAEIKQSKCTFKPHVAFCALGHCWAPNCRQPQPVSGYAALYIMSHPRQHIESDSTIRCHQ